MAARTRSTSPLVMPPSMPPARSVRRPDAARRSQVDLVVGHRAAAAGGLQPVADLDRLDRLHAHEGAGQPRVQPAVPVHVAAQARRQPVDDDLDDAAEGVAVLPDVVDLGDHPLAGRRVGAAHRVLVDAGVVAAGPGRTPSGTCDRPDRDDVADHLDADAPAGGTPGRPRRARPGPRSRGRWPARAPAGRRRSRTSACRRGRRGPGAGGSAGRCGPGRRAPRRRPGRRT